LFSDAYLNAFESVVKQLRISAYLCGGTIRDLLLGRPFKDVDVVVSDRVFEATEVFASLVNAPHFILDQDRKVARVVCGQGNWDFSGFRNHNIEGDLAKRDFTINAMAVRWEDFFPNRTIKRILDPFSGKKDLRKKLIRAVTVESLKEDPLRMLRAFRIHAELKFTVDSSVLKQMEDLHAKIESVAAERITEELDRILLQPDSAACWRSIGNSALFDSLFPEMKPMRGCLQGGYHHLDVWEHSVQALENLENFLPQFKQHFKNHAESLNEYLSSSPGTLERVRLLKWAALLHDIGKPQTMELKEPGRWRFHGHDHVGADLAKTLLNRLKFSRKDTQLISLLIEHHLRPLNLFNQEEIDHDDFYRFYRSAGAEALGVLLIAYADLIAARGPLADPAREQKFLTLIRQMIEYYYAEYYPVISTPELVKGRDLMAILQMSPGPQMGELLKVIREEQLTGGLKDRKQALDFARDWLKRNSL
jgi:poly(A) polymerase